MNVGETSDLGRQTSKRGDPGTGRGQGVQLRMGGGGARNLSKPHPHTCQERDHQGDPQNLHFLACDWPTWGRETLSLNSSGDSSHSEPRPIRSRPSKPCTPYLSSPITNSYEAARPLHCLSNSHCLLLSPHPQVVSAKNSIPLSQGSNSTHPTLPSTPEFPVSPNWTF